MVQIQKADRKTVYRYLLDQGVIVVRKDYSETPHKGTEIPNIQVFMLLRSLKDRGFVDLVFNWQYFYYFLNQEGKKYLADQLLFTEEVVPLTWKKVETRQYEHFDDAGKGRKIRRQRPEGPNRGGRGGRGGRGDRPPRGDKPEQATEKPTTQTPNQEA